MSNWTQAATELARFLALHLASPERVERRTRGRERVASGGRVVLSFTTVPDRIHRIGPALASLLDQSRLPDAVYLNIPEHSTRHGVRYVVPEALGAIPALTISRCRRDWGPATKLIPTLEYESDPDTLIVVADDDQIYPRCMIETFAGWSEQLPDAALCSRGWRLPPGMDHERRNTVYGTDIRAPYDAEIMQGSAGFAVRRRFVDDGFFGYEGAPDAAFYCDDIWIGGQLARRGVRRVVLPFPNHYSRIATWSARRSRALSHAENSDQTNNNTLYRFFQADWKLRD